MERKLKKIKVGDVINYKHDLSDGNLDIIYKVTSRIDTRGIRAIVVGGSQLDEYDIGEMHNFYSKEILNEEYSVLILSYNNFLKNFL